MEIEVEWDTRPKSGLTIVNVTELECNNKNEWDNLDKEEQRKRLNIFLFENELGTVTFTAQDWDEI